MIIIILLIDNFFKGYTPTIYYYLRSLVICLPNFVLYSIVILFSLFLIFILWCLIIISQEFLHNFYTLKNTSPYIKIINPYNNQYVTIQLTYKTYSVTKTIFKCLGYISFIIAIIILLRVSNFNKNIDVNFLIENISNLPGILILILPMILLLYLAFIILFFKNIYLRLFLEIKRLYIYLLQFGGNLDKKSNYYNFYNPSFASAQQLAYVHFFIFNPIKYSRWISMVNLYWYIYDLYKPDIMDYMHKKKDVPKIFRPILYLLQFSSYRDEKIVKLLRVLITQLFRGFWTFLKIFPVVLLIFYVIIECIFNHGVIRNFYLLAFLTYVYNIYFNIYYFLHNYAAEKDRIICIYYYKLDEIKNIEKPVTKYEKILMELFMESITQKNNDLLDIYIKSDLNHKKALAVYKGTDWPKITSDIGIWYKNLKDRILQNKIIIIVLKKLENFF
jgi:hypothetical protein